MLIARTTPRRFGYWLVRRGAHWMRRRRLEIFRMLRENLAYVVPGADDAALDDLAEAAICEAGYSYFDMFHFRPEDLHARGIVEYDPDEWEAARRILADERGTVVVGPHLSSFDLTAQWFVTQGFTMHALSLANPDPGDQVMNTVRRQRGIIVTPIAVNSLREALRRLRQGGIVVTGADRPASYDDELTPFFGVPAPLPRGAIRLALQTDSRVLVAYCVRQPTGRYRLHLPPSLEMEHSGDRREDVERNMRRVIPLIEEAIRSAPAQWGMLVPVWRRPEDA